MKIKIHILNFSNVLLVMVRTETLNFTVDCIFIGHFLPDLPSSSNISHQMNKVSSIKEPF